MSLEELWKVGRSLVFDLQSKLGDLEDKEKGNNRNNNNNNTNNNYDGGDDGSLDIIINEKMNELNRIVDTCKELFDPLTMRNSSSWTIRIRSLEEDHNTLRQDISSYYRKKQQRIEKFERDKLYQNLRYRNVNSDQATDGFLQESRYLENESNSLNRSNQMTDSIFSTGTGIMEKLNNQRKRLENVQRKSINVLKGLNVSNKIIGFIEKRHWGDKWIVIGGIVFTLIFLFILFKFIL